MGSNLRGWGVSALAAALASGVPGTAPGHGAAPSENDPPGVAEVQAVLDASEFEQALATARLALEYDPESVALLDLAARAAEELGEYDLAIWYTGLALQELQSQDPESKDAEPLRARITELDLIASHTPDLVQNYESFVRDLFEMGRSCVAKKMYVNAVDMFSRCADTSLEQRANAELDRIYGNGDAATALADSGVDVPARRLTAREARRLALRDADHATWEDAYERDTANYEIRTDMGYEILDSVALAMEQMNRFYRKVFDAKNPKKIELRVYRSREEFDKIESENRGEQIPPEVRAFYVDAARYVAIYDPRTDGRSLPALWSTLFHEASHQFTHEIAKTAVPTWLNEGTASYFEGARLLPNRSVTTNDIPESRLRHLHLLFAQGTPTLRSVVSYDSPGSYPGEYYPVGWGLVYFLHNYEDDSCERIYVKPYRDFMKAYRRSVKDAAYDHFVKVFVDEVKDPAVKSFEDFEKRFQTWMEELHGNYFGPPDRYAYWVERGRKQQGFRKNEAAQESYRYALRKNPTSIAAHFELGQILAEEKQKDAAIYHLRTALRQARSMEPDGAVPLMVQTTAAMIVQQCLELLGKLDKNLAQGIARSSDGLAQAALAAAGEYVTGGFPRSAARVLEDAVALLGPHRELQQKRAEILRDAEIDLRRWRRFLVSEDLGAWSPTDDWKVSGRTLVSEERDFVNLVSYQEELPERFRYEATLKLNGVIGIHGLVFGDSSESPPHLVGIIGTRVSLMQMPDPDTGEAPKLELLGEIEKEQVLEHTIALDVGPEGIVVYCDGKKVGEKELEARKTRGRVGVFSQGVEVHASDLRVLY